MTKTILRIDVMRTRRKTRGARSVFTSSFVGASLIDDAHDLVVETGLGIDDIWHRFDCAIVFREPDLRFINAFVGLG
jgi:hypothetical protein